MSVVIALLLWFMPFAVAAWLVSAGFSPWTAMTICFVLLFFVSWGFSGRQVD